MSFEAACAMALARSAAVGACAVPVAASVRHVLRAMPRRWQPIVWLIGLAPFLMPNLLVAYAFSGSALSIATAPWLERLPWPGGGSLGAWVASHESLVNELLLDMILLTRAVPVALVVQRLMPPPPVSAQAVQALRLLARGPLGWRARVYAALVNAVHGPGRGAAVSGLIAMLVAFQEFELVARLGRPSWTVWLFDAQAVGISLAESLRKAVLPVGLQAAILCPCLWHASRPSRQVAYHAGPSRVSVDRGMLVAAYLVVAFLLGCVAPLGMLSASLPRGMAALLHQPTQLSRLVHQTLTGMLIAIAATATAWWILSSSRYHSRAGAWLRRVLLFGAALPGATGPLVVTLLALYGIQHSWLHVLRGTFVPWVLAQTIWILPRALLLHLLLAAATDAASLHAARLLAMSPDKGSARRLVWRLEGVPRLAGAWLLGWWCYLDLTTSHLLAPPGMASAPVTLYIQMHYGRNDVLTAMTLVTVMVPLLLLLAILGAAPWYLRWMRP